MHNFGYVIFLDSKCTELELYELDKDGLVRERTPLFGKENVFRQIIPNNQIIQICRFNKFEDKENDRIGIQTYPVSKIQINTKKYKSASDLLDNGDPDMLIDMFSDFYSLYVDKIVSEMIEEEDAYQEG